jgi:hypothetical protein
MSSNDQEFCWRTTSELGFAILEIAWWEDRVARGLTTREHAAPYLTIEQNIVRLKRAALGIK